MTAYDDNLQKTEMESMPELYFFSSGDRQEYVTSYYQDVQFLGNTYQARPLKRSGFTFDKNFSPVTMSVTAPLTDIFIRYVASQPIEPTRLKMYRAIDSDLADFRVVFSGTLRKIGISNRMAKASFESKARNLRFRIPKILYQSYCNWDVFEPGCGLVASAFLDNVSVLVSGDQLVSTFFATKPDGYYTSGRVISPQQDERWIIDHVGNTLTLHVPFDTRVSSGTIVSVLPGCDGDPVTCRDKFSNLDNFIGMPYIPSHNPVIYSLV